MGLTERTGSARAGKPCLSEGAGGRGLSERTDEPVLSARASMPCLSEGAGRRGLSECASMPCLSERAGGLD